MCNCEFCAKCDCGHKADEHMAGDGMCYRCDCDTFHSNAVDAWDKLTINQQKETSFEKFINEYLGA